MADRRNLSMFAWGDTLRAAKLRRRRLARRALLTGIGCAALGVTIALPPAPRLVWNASASAPIGLYGVVPGATARRGDMVVAQVPASARGLAVERRYIPANVPLVKRVAGGPGDDVCARGDLISVNGRPVAIRRAVDGHGRPLPWWTGCLTLGQDALFLLMTGTPDSFDGRYFGPTRKTDIIGRATPLWVR